MSNINKLQKLVNQVNNANLPDFAKKFLLTYAFNSKVKYAMTSGIRVESLAPTEAKLQLKNRWRIQNHIKGIHACGMALLAESASGIVFGLNVPDTHLPLLKSMKIQYNKRTTSDLYATATITNEQIQELLNSNRGDMKIDVKVIDSFGNTPIETEMIWAWIEKKK